MSTSLISSALFVVTVDWVDIFSLFRHMVFSLVTHLPKSSVQASTRLSKTNSVVVLGGLTFPWNQIPQNLCALSSPNLVSKTHLAVPPKEERRIQSACSPGMVGYRQRWLQENRTWLYLSCLSPLYLYGPGECECNMLTPPTIK